ncbi:MAG TPA: LuxR C-terminal-related transcriptional regulator [Nevskiales bacterium]|nr:LuxR C-terminal-related transcriptional regulator [Nevskiales bacterium]
MTKSVPKQLRPVPATDNPPTQSATPVRQKLFVTTKLRPPTNKANLIERPRLMEILGHTLSRKLALIHAPAGFGKTTLAAQWHDRLHATGITVAWLAIDAADNDLERFLAYVVEAIRAAEPDIGAGLTEVIESNPGNAAEFVLGDLINEFELYDKEFVLFLDDWHLIHEPKIHQALELFLSRVPPNFHLVVTSRSRAGIPLARLRVQNELVEINAADLRFDYTESSTFLSDAKALQLGAEDLEVLWRSTEGWVAALQLASISLRSAGDRDRILRWVAGTPHDIGEYLAENVLDSLPKDLVDFMLKTSILGRLSGELCRAVTGEAASAQFLDALERQELFLLPLDEERQWFRYHHLFARFLQRRLEREHPGLMPKLHLAASDWFAAHGQTAEALAHALAADEVERAIALVEKDAMALMQNSYMSTLLGLVAQLPQARLFDRPILQTAVAWAHCLTHHPHESEEALAHVIRVASTQPPQTQKLLLGEANVIRACNGVYADRIDDVETMVRPCLNESAIYSPWVVGVAANILTYRHIHTYQFDKVAPLQTWARDYQDRAQGLFSGVYGRCFSGIAACWAGDLALGKKHFLDALVLARDTAGRQSHAARLAGALLGQLKYEANELEETEQLLQESRILGFEGGVVDFYLATFISTCRLMVQKGDYAEASAILQEGEDTARHLRLDRLAMAVAGERVRLSLLVGDIRGAERTLADFDGRFAGAEPPVAGIAAQIWDYREMARARLLCEQGYPEQAVTILRTQSRRAQDSGRKYHEVAINVLLAIALDVAGQGADAEETLARTVADAVPRGIIRTFLDEGPRVVVILERLREKARRHQAAAGGLPEFGASANLLVTTSRHPDRGLPLLVASRAPATSTEYGARTRAPFDDSLKRREIDIIRFLDQGRSNKEIARALGISVDTVKWYLKAIFCKLGVARRGQAIAEARRLRLLDEP